jgi:threo-3-hydroxy-L-aspartate ammonia-lyase
VISLADVEAAAERLRGVANRTPVLTSRTLDQHSGATVYLKAESFQRAGSFKFRGAYNRLAQLSEEERARGVAAYSSGNHAGALALAASLLGTKATILMPEDTPAAKLAATRSYGADVVTFDRYTEDREELGRRLADERGLTLVPPYEDDRIMAGQGTAALELLEDVGELDVLITPVGGGGLIAGASTVAKGRLPNIKVYGVEPAEGDDHRRSLEAGERVRIDVPRTIADGLQGNVPGQMTFEVNRRLLDGIVTVTDPQIVEAMLFLFDRMKVVTEPSGAVGVAALLQQAVPDVEGKRVGVIISGGNVGSARFVELVTTFGS